VSDASIARARTLTRALLAARGEAGSETHHVEIVTFARHAERVAVPEDPQALELDRLEGTDSATDLASALRFAEALFLPGRLPRLWVLSDGLETRGQALAMVPELASHGVRVMVTPYEGAIASELTVTGLSFPEEIRAGQPFEVRVSVRATADARARVRLYQDDRLVGLDGVQEVELHAGDDEVSFRTVARERGTVELRAELEPLAPEASAAGGERRDERRSLRGEQPLRPRGGRDRAGHACSSRVRSRRAWIPSRACSTRPRSTRTYAGLAASRRAPVSSRASMRSCSPTRRPIRSRRASRARSMRTCGAAGRSSSRAASAATGSAAGKGRSIERLLPVSHGRARDGATQPSLALALVIDRSRLDGGREDGAREGRRESHGGACSHRTTTSRSSASTPSAGAHRAAAERVEPPAPSSGTSGASRPRGGTAIFPGARRRVSGSRRHAPRRGT
jgi:hypothetical protein